jgi:hypothetical protein
MDFVGVGLLSNFHTAYVDRKKMIPTAIPAIPKPSARLDDFFAPTASPAFHFVLTCMEKNTPTAPIIMENNTAIIVIGQ